MSDSYQRDTFRDEGEFSPAIQTFQTDALFSGLPPEVAYLVAVTRWFDYNNDGFITFPSILMVS